ncbi:hypothetical protein OS190_13610 [Sulfitobacter sp. F26204]|uniref:hypothetical protein n=1 Tax=Sulfitobacter sp. F26204 TaxID=2996014 RepID=UPI00225E3BEB|nr:hypothetical protein [Sulfitobacter sp. F26204]MCX7560609.1 hypothetical protein [Sulfitobacter sp. F26204]
MEIPTDNGGTITVTIGEDDFIIDAARSQAEPLLDRAVDYVGSGMRAAVSHPIDVNVAWWYTAARMGAFDIWSTRPRENAEGLARIFMDNAASLHRASDRRIAIQMLLLYYETDLRSKLLWQLAARQVGGTILSFNIYSFGGRLAPNLATKAALASHNFFASMAGAAVRACIAVAENRTQGDLTGHIVGPHFLINALLTGDDTMFNLAHMLGPPTYFQLIAHLREHPEAIQIDDAEYALINRVVIWLEEYFTSPSEALNNLPQNETIEFGP